MSSTEHREEADSSHPNDAGQQVVLVLSAMRSGSTLLKALLGAAPDISHLPEVNFQRYKESPERLTDLSSNRIVVLKKPCWFTEVRRYPRLPSLPSLQKIILVRDVYDTVQSLKKMMLGPLAGSTVGHWLNRPLVEHYWCRVYENIVHRVAIDESVLVVRYEDLVFDPIPATERLFHFVGSKQQEGIDHYTQPKDYKWKWFYDDASPKIKSLKVQPPKKIALDYRLLSAINGSERAWALRKRFGYVNRR